MDKEVKTRNIMEIMKELEKMNILSQKGDNYHFAYGVCASFYRWLFCKTETKVSDIMGEDQYWSREIGQC